MKTQKHNQGPLKDLKVKIEEDVYESLLRMADNSELTIDEIVVISLKRFRASHAELLGKAPTVE